MIRKITKVKFGGRIYESIAILNKHKQIILEPSLYLLYLSIKAISPITIYNYSYTLNKYFEYLSTEDIDWFNVTDVEMSAFIYNKFQKNQKVKDSTIVIYTIALEGFYNWAWETDHLSHPLKFNFPINFKGASRNNNKGIKVVAKALVSQYIKKKKFNSLLEHLTTNDAFLLQRNELMLSIAYYMGLRRSEITSPINFTLKELKKLKKEKKKTKYLSIYGKGEKSRKVLVLKEIEHLIFRHINSSLFPSNSKSLICDKDGNPIGSNVLYKAFRGAVKASMDSYWDTRVLHSLRHTFATNMITYLYNSGQQNYHTVLSKMMGHENETTTNIYICFEDHMKKRNSLIGKTAIKPKYFRKTSKK